MLFYAIGLAAGVTLIYKSIAGALGKIHQNDIYEEARVHRIRLLNQGRNEQAD